MSRIDSDATICAQIQYFMPGQLIPGSILKYHFKCPWIEIMSIKRNNITNFLSSHIDILFGGFPCYAPIWQSTWGNSGWKQHSGLLLVTGEGVAVYLENLLDQKVFHVWSLSSFSSQCWMFCKMKMFMWPFSFSSYSEMQFSYFKENLELIINTCYYLLHSILYIT